MDNPREFVIVTRTKLKMSAEAFGEEIGFSSRSIYRWESGETQPSSQVLINIMKLCKERGICLDDLF